MTKIFLSGPMFSPADLWDQHGIDEVCTAAGHTTYLASRDGVEDEQLIQGLKNPLIEMSAFQQLALAVQKLGWAHDCHQLMSSDAVVFNMNGRVPDGGSINEASMAFAAGIPVVNYKETSITMWGPFDNPMIAALTHDWAPVTTKVAIPAALAAALDARATYSYEYTPPEPFAHALAVGKFVADHRDTIMTVLTDVEKALDGKALMGELEKLAGEAGKAAERGIGWLRSHLHL